MYKIEDERFELDIVMEVNLSAIQALESVQLHMNTLTNEQLNNFQLDDYLGGQSQVTQKQAVQRIYGERASEIIDGLKRNPRVAVPIVLKRLVHWKFERTVLFDYDVCLVWNRKMKNGENQRKISKDSGKNKVKNTIWNHWITWV